MLIFELRLTVRPYLDELDSLPFRDYVFLKRSVTVHCDFMPNELSLAFSKPHDTVLRETFEVTCVRWDEIAGKLIVFVKEKDWPKTIWDMMLGSIGQFGWEIFIP